MRRTLPEERKPSKKPKKKKVTKKKAVDTTPAKDLVTCKSGKVMTYTEYLEHFKARTKYIMQKQNIKFDDSLVIKYINSGTAHIATKAGKRFLYIGANFENKDY